MEMSKWANYGYPTNDSSNNYSQTIEKKIVPLKNINIE